MAGTILISDSSGLATSTVEFDYFTERIRAAFNAGEDQVVSEIYDPVDEGGMTYISVADKEDEVFRCFGDAVLRAYALSEHEPSFLSYKEKWLDLIDRIKADPRWNRAE